jgi:hypothetical protein
VDTAAPSVTLVSPADGAFVKGTVPLSVTASAGMPVSKVEFYLDKATTPVGQGTFSAATKSWDFALGTGGGKSPVADGDHTWYAKVTDAAGNSAVSATRTLHVDNSAPRVTVTNPGLGILGETHYTVTGTARDQPAQAGSGVTSVQVTIVRASDTTTLSTGTATLTGTTWSYAYTPTEAGNQVAMVKAVDAAGNAASTVAGFTVDHRPVVNLPATASGSEGTALTVSGSVSDPDGVNPPDGWTATVNYGDNTGAHKLTLNPDKTFDLGHVYQAGGTFPITVAVTDKYGVTGKATVKATVAHVPPTNLTLTPSARTIKENGSVSLGGRFTAPGKDAHTVTINWGDGSKPDVVTLGAGVLTFSKAHHFLESGTDSITVNVAPNDGGGTDQAATQVTVQNVAPSGTTLKLDKTIVNEGGTVALSGKFVDPGPTDTHSVTINWGDGSKPTTLNLGAGVLTFGAGGGLTHTYQTSQKNSAPYTITATVADEDGATGRASAHVIVKHGPPTDLTVRLDKKTIDEGGTVNLSASFADPGTQEPHTATISWGDGSTDTVGLAAGALTFTRAHQYLDARTDHVAVKVADTAGGSAVNGTNVVAVKDVAPSGTTLKLDKTTAEEGELVTLRGSFTDPGTRDAHLVTINWGDGSSADTVSLGAGVLTFREPHRFRKAGTDHVTVTVTGGRDGGSDHAGTQVAVTHVPSTNATLKLDKKSINEGGQVILSGSFDPPGSPEAHTVTINWGDGSAPDTLKLAAGVRAFGNAHQYLDSRPGSSPYTITATVTDTEGGTKQATAAVTVKAVPPTASIAGPAAGVVGQTLSFAGNFKDPAPGDSAGDSFAWKVRNDVGKVLKTGSQPDFSFVPAAPGKYVVSFRVTDNDGATKLVAKTVTVTAPPPAKTGTAGGLAAGQLASGSGGTAGSAAAGSQDSTKLAALFQKQDWGRLF